jgi:hypothetical protein
MIFSILKVEIGVKHNVEVHNSVHIEILKNVEISVRYDVVNDPEKIDEALSTLLLYTQNEPALFRWSLKDRSKLALLIVRASIINNGGQTLMVEATGCKCDYFINIEIDSVEEGEIEIVSPRIICQPLCIIRIVPGGVLENTEFIYIIEMPLKAILTFHILKPVECHECQLNQTIPCLNYLGVEGKFTVEVSE